MPPTKKMKKNAQKRINPWAIAASLARPGTAKYERIVKAIKKKEGLK